MFLQNISIEVVGIVIINMSPSDYFPNQAFIGKG